MMFQEEFQEAVIDRQITLLIPFGGPARDIDKAMQCLLTYKRAGH